MKIYQKLEQILKFRIYSNPEIPEYLKKLSLMGKIDAVAQIALFNLILTKLGEIEDKEEILPKSEEVHVMPEFPERRGGTLAPDEYKCPDCDIVAKSKLGLISHSRKHNK